MSQSQSQSVVPRDAADPPSDEDGKVAHKPNRRPDGAEANLGSRPSPIPDHSRSPNASTPIASTSSGGPPTSPSHQQTPSRQEPAIEQEAAVGDAAGDALAPVNPLESTTHDTARQGPKPVSLIPAIASPPIQAKPTTPRIRDPRPPVTSYIPPSPRPQPQAQAQTSLAKEQAANDAAVLSSRTGSMFRLSTPAHRRRNMANTNALTNYEADLTSRDRAKEKEAVRGFLDDKISDEWSWQWPRPSNAHGHEFVDHLAITGRKAVCWKERDEWLSNTNDTDDEPAMPSAESPDTASPPGSFKFESPDDVGDAIKRKELQKKRRRQLKLKEELAYNEGLRCFTARRDAWTGGRPVNREITRTSSRTLSSVVASIDAQRPPGEDHNDDDNDDDDIDSSDSDPALEIPVAPPLLPPTSGMRAGITPAAYNVIYDKVVLQSISPSCPVNLQDIISSCVQGWKRDGEWPPKGTAAEPLAAARKRKGRKLSMAGIFGLSRIAKEIAEDEKGAEGEGGIRRGIQKMLGLRRDSSTGINGNGNANANANANGHGNANGNGHLVKGKEGDVALAAA